MVESGLEADGKATARVSIFLLMFCFVVDVFSVHVSSITFSVVFTAVGRQCSAMLVETVSFCGWCILTLRS